MDKLFDIHMEKQAVNAVSPLGLAHVGDAVFELLVRTALCAGGRTRPAALHHAAVAQVRAQAQAARMERLLPLLTDEELDYYRRGRNAHARHDAPKGATCEEYAKASGLETLFGALYLLGRRARLEQLFTETMEEPHAV